MIVYHVSDQAGIKLFEPRPAPERSAISGDAVWAVDERHLPNYLLPRDCPRVCLSRNANTTEEDVQRFFGYTTANRIICVEWNWLAAIRDAVLYIYRLDSSPFECIDAGAGYYVSRKAVSPNSSTVISDVFDELKARDVELRFVSDLWPIHEAAAKSTLEFSMIRMRNAKPG
jgi:hypothetical protein